VVNVEKVGILRGKGLEVSKARRTKGEKKIKEKKNWRRDRKLE
jgi:hypothetical protein